MTGGFDLDDTPPQGLPSRSRREPPQPVVIERGRGWRWVAIGAIVLAVVAGAVVAWLLLAGGGEEDGPGTALVPQVTDFQWQDARSRLEEAGFIPIHQGVPRDRGVDGAVFEQDPPANTEAEPGSFVEIFYTILPPEQTETPGVGPPETATATPTTPAPTSTSPTSTSATMTPGPGTEGDQVVVAEPLDPPWIAIVASPDNEDDARQLFAQRYEPTYPGGGVLYSSNFSQMRAGFWVVYVAQFRTREEAQAFCHDTFGAPPPGRQPDCYARTTEPGPAAASTEGP